METTQKQRQAPKTEEAKPARQKTARQDKTTETLLFIFPPSLPRDPDIFDLELFATNLTVFNG